MHDPHTRAEFPVKHAILETRRRVGATTSAAMRRAVYPQTRAARDAFFASRPDPRCELSDQPIVPSYTDVDHYPVSFAEIAEAWVDSRDAEPQIIEQESRWDPEKTEWVVTNAAEKREWAEFHRARAEYRILDRQVHRDHSKAEQLRKNAEAAAGGR